MLGVIRPSITILIPVIGLIKGKNLKLESSCRSIFFRNGGVSVVYQGNNIELKEKYRIAEKNNTDIKLTLFSHDKKPEKIPQIIFGREDIFDWFKNNQKNGEEVFHEMFELLKD